MTPPPSLDVISTPRTQKGANEALAYSRASALADGPPSQQPRRGVYMAQKINFAKLSLQDALDLAILIEAEAKDRYDEFARLVGGRYKGDSDEVFKNMALYEAKHGAELQARRAKLFGNAPASVSLDAIDDVEAPDRGQPRVFMS